MRRLFILCLWIAVYVFIEPAGLALETDQAVESVATEANKSKQDWNLAKERTAGSSDLAKDPAQTSPSPSSSSSSREKNFFFCGYWGTPKVHKAKMSDYFDKVFVYEKSHSGYTAHFLLQKPFKVQFHAEKDIIFWFELNKTLSGEREGFPREAFNVHHFNIKTKVLQKSQIHYLRVEDYEKNFKYRSEREIKEPLELVKKAVPKNHVKIAWGASWWKCRSVSYFKYLLFSLRELFFQIGGV